MTKEIVQLLCKHLHVQDVITLLHVNKWCNRMFSDKYVWCEMAHRLSSFLSTEMVIDIPNMNAALFKQWTLQFPCWFTCQQKFAHWKRIITECAAGNEKGEILNAIARCNGFVCFKNNIRALKLAKTQNAISRIVWSNIQWTIGTPLEFVVKTVLFTEMSNRTEPDIDASSLLVQLEELVKLFHKQVFQL